MAMQSRSLHGRVAVITGGGRGIGRALALALTREGCRVAIGDVDEAAAAAVAREAGGETLGLRLDVTDRPGFTAFLDEVERRLGPIEVLVNNAGIMPVGPFESEDDATVIRILEIDLHAVLHGSKEAVRRMRPRGSGHIVNVASIAGRVGFPNLATYSAAKHGVIGLSEALRQELRGTGVDVSVVMPAIVRTELAAGLRPSRGFKPSTPEEVAEAIVEALRKNRFDVYVPRSLGPTWVGMIALPRAMQIYGAALDTDHSTRAAYEARAAASAPATDAVIAEAAAEPDSREQAAA
jgi:NAD(P)-dependent dehydrogenase (short-subunit alcohol dehydrogenase family)